MTMDDSKPSSTAASTADLYPEYIGSKGKYTMKGSSKKGRCLIFFNFVFFVAFAVFLALFIVYFHKYNDIKDASEATDEKNKKLTSEGVCQSFDCLEAAAYITRSINASVDPCEDFYQFACGRWVAEHPIPADAESITSFKLISDDIKEILKDLLIIDDDTAPQAVQQARAYFRSCEDVDTMDKRGKKPLFDLLDLNGTGIYPTLQPSWKDTNMTFTDIVEYLTKVGDAGSNAFVSMGVYQDEMQSDKHIITFSQTGLVLPSRDAYLRQRNSSDLMLYETLYRQVHMALGADEKTATDDARDVVDFEIQLANATEPPENMRDRFKQFQKMPLANLSKMFPEFDWLQYLQNQFSTSGVNITKDEVIANDGVKYYTNLFSLVKRTPRRTLLNYGMWRKVYGYIGLLDKQLQDLFRNFKKTLNGIARLQERWKVCVAETDYQFPYAVGRLYVDQKFTQNDKHRMEKMIESLSTTFQQMLQENEWMTKPTKEAALKKLSLIRHKIGYPDFILNDTALNAKSEMYKVNETDFFETNLDIQRKDRSKDLRELRKPVDKTDWSMSASTVNAYYSGSNNEIVFPAGILNKPFFSTEFSDALIYGGIGMVIAHEITHGFDDSGSSFDENGNLRKWWEDEDLKNFKNRTQCIREHYNSFVDKELNISVNGLLTLGENIADCGGIKEAFRAYRNAVKGKGREEEKYPSLPYTQDQLFFIGFAQSWCSNYRPKAREIHLQSDYHSPNYFRVIGPVQNSEDFGRIFNCPVGKPMNPQHKCYVW